jgi:hypothetical protein
MTVVVAWKWVVKPEKQKEYDAMMKRYIKWLKEPPIPKELKSVRAFTGMFGGTYGSYVELVEYESLAAYEKVNEKNLKDKEYMQLMKDFLETIEPSTLSIEVWNTIM